MSRIDSRALEGRGPHPLSSLPGVTQDLARMVWQRAVLTGAINAGLNFWLQYRRFAPRSQVPLTVDQISSRETTVFGTAIPMALFMSVILTVSMILAMRKQLRQAAAVAFTACVLSISFTVSAARAYAATRTAAG